MEECRAEAVALYLASNPEILEIFGYESKQDKDDLTYFTFVVMVRAGIVRLHQPSGARKIRAESFETLQRALEFYDPEKGKHGQAHMEARLGITNWLIDNQLASIEFVRSSSGELTDAFARVDRQAVLSRSKEVMGRLLLEIQTRKSTGDRAGAEAFYKKLTKPSQEWIEELRPLVLGTSDHSAHLSMIRY